MIKKKTYSDEFKLQIIQEYLNSNIGCRNLAKKYNLPSKNYISRWKAELIKKGLLKDTTLTPKHHSSIKNIMNGKSAYEKQLEQENLELKAKLAILKELEKLGVDIHKKK